MPEVHFRGKTYNSEFEMPDEVRHAYQEEQRRKSSTKSLTDVVDIPDEVKGVYERALGRVDETEASLQRPSDLPATEDLYRQSAPQDMKHLPSDESVYRPSESVIGQGKSTIEAEPGLTTARLVSSVIWAVILIAIAFLVLQFFS